jgi:hypothetical protein
MLDGASDLGLKMLHSFNEALSLNRWQCLFWE